MNQTEPSSICGGDGDGGGISFERVALWQEIDDMIYFLAAIETGIYLYIMP